MRNHYSRKQLFVRVRLLVFHPLLPLYSLARSGQTTDAANAVTGGASQRLVLRRSGAKRVSLSDWPNEKCRPDCDTGTTASS
jgi:hypothetical protein